MILSEKSKNKIKDIRATAFEWVVIIFYALVVGTIGGVVGSAFARSLSFVTELRAEHSWIIYLLPVGGLVSVLIYKLTKENGYERHRKTGPRPKKRTDL